MRQNINAGIKKGAHSILRGVKCVCRAGFFLRSGPAQQAFLKIKRGDMYA